MSLAAEPQRASCCNLQASTERLSAELLQLRDENKSLAHQLRDVQNQHAVANAMLEDLKRAQAHMSKLRNENQKLSLQLSLRSRSTTADGEAGGIAGSLLSGGWCWAYNCLASHVQWLSG